MRDLLDRRAIFFGGKGGVGKTTCSAAFALAAARAGRRVRLVSTDPAHSIADSLETRVAPGGSDVVPGLRALEIDPDRAVERYVDAAKQRLSALFAPGVVKAAARQIELAAGMPGAAEAAVFDRIAEILLDPAGNDEVVVFDTAPTGHTLRLLRTPELMSAWLQALARRRRHSDPDASAPDPVIAALDARVARLEAARAALVDGARVAVVLVLIPERLPIEETVRAVHALEDSGVTPAAVIVNRVLPGEADGDYLQQRRAQEQHYLEEIDRRLSAFPRLRVPQLESDVHGLDALARVGRHLLEQ